MTSVQVNIDKEMTNMVKCFRVIDLQELLGSVGRNKNGRKSDLVERALQMIRTKGSNNVVQAKILELYSRRYPLETSSVSFSSLLNRYPDKYNDKSSNATSTYPDPLQRNCKDEVKFKPLPFYENISDILRPFLLITKFDHSPQGKSVTFRINEQQASRIYHQDTDDLFRKCIQVQLSFKPLLTFWQLAKHYEKHQPDDRVASFMPLERFCLSDSSSEQGDRLPPDLKVKVNDCFVPLPPPIQPTRAGDPPKHQHRPLDITAICTNIGLHKIFNLSIKWSCKIFQNYVVRIKLVRELTVDELLKKLELTGPLPPAVSRAVIREKLAVDPESDISTTSLKVSLLCPLGKMRMQLPTRPVECRHLQCFDATLFLKMNERKPTWTCPVCDKPAEFRSLRIDGLFLEILKASDSDEIDFTEDGNWHCAKKKVETSVNSNQPIDLSQSGQKASEVDSIRKNVDVIDLTGDTSDEEETSIAPPKSPCRTSSITPMSLSSSPGDMGFTKLKNGHLDMTSSNPHLSPYRKSPQQKISTKPYLSPASSPYCKSESPLFKTRISQSQSYQQAKPFDLSSHHTPSKQTTLPSQFSPFSFNGVKDPTQNLQIPSPYVSSTPPTVNGLFPNLDFRLDRYSPSLHLNGSLNDPNFLLRFPPSTSFDFLSSRYLMNPGTSINPYLLQPPLSLLNSYTLPGMPHSSAVPATDSRSSEYGLNTPRLDFTDDLLNFNPDSVD